jgi:hypothetical protein
MKTKQKQAKGGGGGRKKPKGGKRERENIELVFFCSSHLDKIRNVTPI